MKKRFQDTKGLIEGHIVQWPTDICYAILFTLSLRIIYIFYKTNFDLINTLYIAMHSVPVYLTQIFSLH